jgi:predicted NACHT family NTPase
VESILIAELSIAEFPASDALLKAALNSGDVLVLFDGLDEIPTSDLSAAVAAVRDFVNRYSDCRYVISCRTAVYRQWFGGFNHFVLSDFDDQQIAEFAGAWFTRKDEIEAKAAHLFLSLLKSDAHRGARELARSPLMLTFLCLVFRRTQRFPPNTAQLYAKALRIYLEEWNASKLVHNNPEYAELSPEIEMELLKEIAAPMFLSDRFFFTKDELLEAIGNFLRTEKNAPKSMTPGKVLDAIAGQHGLLVERAQYVWSFSHLTIQEYLAAALIVERESIEILVRKHHADARWHEVFSIMAGLTLADRMLEALAREADMRVSRSRFLSELGELARRVMAEQDLYTVEPQQGTPEQRSMLRIFFCVESIIIARRLISSPELDLAAVEVSSLWERMLHALTGKTVLPVCEPDDLRIIVGCIMRNNSSVADLVEHLRLRLLSARCLHSALRASNHITEAFWQSGI